MHYIEFTRSDVDDFECKQNQKLSTSLQHRYNKELMTDRTGVHQTRQTPIKDLLVFFINLLVITY